MKNEYSFIKKMDDDDIVYVIYSENLKQMKLSETFDSWGQQIDRGVAGDGLVLLSKCAVDEANRVAREQDLSIRYSVDSYLACFSANDEVINAVMALQEGNDYEYFAELVTGFNYWDGSNWMSIIVNREHQEAPYQVIDDENLIQEYLKAIDKRKFHKSGFGKKVYQFQNLQIVDNYCQGAWATWELKPLEN